MVLRWLDVLLVIDNYDSFVHNLARHFRRLGQTTCVVRNDQVTPDGVARWSPTALVLSPGPGVPDDAGNSLAIVRHWRGRLPILGVCLGHQTIAQAWGAKVQRGRQPVHGRASQLHHGGQGVFAGLPTPLRVGRYHSLVVPADSLPDSLAATAWTSDGTLMAFEHRVLPIVGLQFHPESVLTEAGFPILAAFLRRAGLPVSKIPHSEAPPRDVSLGDDTRIDRQWPSVPITF